MTGVAVHKHAEEESNHVQDLSRRKHKMAEMCALELEPRLKLAIQIRVQVGMNNYLL